MSRVQLALDVSDLDAAIVFYSKLFATPPAKVRTFIDHLVEHFSQTPNHQLGEQWIKDGIAKPGAPAMNDDGSSGSLVAHSAYAEAEDEPQPVAAAARSIDGELGPKLAKPSRTRPRMPVHSPF